MHVAAPEMVHLPRFSEGGSSARSSTLVFSGNGTLDVDIAERLGELDAAVYVPRIAYRI